MDYILINHYEPEVETIGDFIHRGDARLTKSMTAQQLVDYKITLGGVEISNRDRIFERYDAYEEKENQNKPADLLLLKPNTQLALPKANVVQETLFVQGGQLVRAEAQAFMGDKLSELMHDKGYQTVLDSAEGNVTSAHPTFTVWLWCRSLGEGGQWINVSPFVQKIDIEKNHQLGGFALTLTPVVGSYEGAKWKIKKENIQTNINTNQRHEYLQQSHTFRYGFKNERREENFFFHSAIASNDLIYIRMNLLGMEREQRLREKDGFVVSPDMIPGKVYDMIGLVDSNTKVENFEANEISIQIQGRDLSKVFVEDGCFFFPLEYAGGMIANVGTEQRSENRLIQRSFVSGKLQALNAYLERSISFSMQFVLNQLSNTGLVPNEVFKGYNQQVLSSTYELENEMQTREVQGVYKIIKLLVDPSISDLRIADSSIAVQQGSILNYFDKIVQEPFAQMLMDTYGDQFYIIIRRAPFDFKRVTSYLYDTFLNEKHHFGWGKVGKTTSASGSTTQWDEKGINEAMIIGDEYLPEVLVTATRERDFGLSPVIIDIDSSVILRQSLTFRDEEVYSWYAVKPQGYLWGNGDGMTFAFIPAVFLEKYADIWGARAMDLVSNYVPFLSLGDHNADKKQNTIEKQSIEDLKYLIDSHSYLPFTRSGTITIKLDRRIKIGTFIYNKLTNEICYVDSVAHSVEIGVEGIEATTTIGVSRCMVLDYILGKEVPGVGQKVSYFNIVNTSINEVALNSDQGAKAAILDNWKVNEQVFNFFLQRKQFVDPDMHMKVFDDIKNFNSNTK